METNKIKWVLGGCSGRMITVNGFYGGDGFIADVDTLGNAERIIECVNNYDALKEENERLKEALHNLYNFTLGKEGYLDSCLNDAEYALHKSTVKEDGNNEQ